MSDHLKFCVRCGQPVVVTADNRLVRHVEPRPFRKPKCPSCKWVCDTYDESRSAMRAQGRFYSNPHREQDHLSSKKRACGNCIVAEGSMAGMTYWEVEEMTARMAAAGCANCGSSHDHANHPDRCCDETCPTGGAW